MHFLPLAGSSLLVLAPPVATQQPDQPAAAPKPSGEAGDKASGVTFGLNWNFNPYAKLMFNWVRFGGDDSPLDPIGSKTEGNAFCDPAPFGLLRGSWCPAE